MAGEIYNAQDEINGLNFNRPHLVILGAGASRQAFPNGDANGKLLPIMNELSGVLDLEGEFGRCGIDYASTDFEKAYSDLALSGQNRSTVELIQKRIHDYFSSLQLPDHPTLYDHLVLSSGRRT